MWTAAERHGNGCHPMNTMPIVLLSVALAASTLAASENPVFDELLQKGVTTSQGVAVQLPPPILPDGLDAAGQKAALAKAADPRTPLEEMMQDSVYAPAAVKIRSAKASDEEEGPTVRTIDVWFIVRGDWNVLTSKDFFESAIHTKDEGPSRVIVEAGMLNDQELAERKLTAVVKEDFEERFLYTTFRLFDRVQVSVTRFSVLTKSKNSSMAAGRLDPRFLHDAAHPNEWRPLIRDERTEVKLGDAQPFSHAGGYAKITRLLEPDNAVLVECHLVYEEPYGWFDGANLVRQKVPLMVNEKVRVFRRKLAAAVEKK